MMGSKAGQPSCRKNLQVAISTRPHPPQSGVISGPYATGMEIARCRLQKSLFGHGAIAATDNEMEAVMNALERALLHISHGTSYSWDLSTLISSGVSLPQELRQRILAGTTTKFDAIHVRDLLGNQAKARRFISRH